MKVPVTVSVGGFKFRVEYPDAIPDESGDLSGNCTVSTLTIKISKTQNPTPEIVLRTLFHELVHAALGLTGHSEMLGEKHEEGITYALENMLAGLFVFSPNAAVTYREVDFPWE